MASCCLGSLPQPLLTAHTPLWLCTNLTLSSLGMDESTLMGPTNEGLLGACDAQSWGEEMGALEGQHTPLSRLPITAPAPTEDCNKGKCVLARKLAGHPD